MTIERVFTTQTLTKQQIHLLDLIEVVTTEYERWHGVCVRIQMQIVNDFQRLSPTPEQTCSWIEDYQVFAMALHELATKIEQEAGEVTDQFYTWLYD